MTKESPRWNDAPRDSVRISFPEIPGFGDAVRSIVREEIVRALGALAREADHLGMPYETAELDSRALGNIKAAAEGAVQRLLCPHEKHYIWYGVSRCARCGEPETMPENPFTSLDPNCNHAFTTEDDVTKCQICEGVKA